MEINSFSITEIVKTSWHAIKGTKKTFWIGILILCLLSLLNYFWAYILQSPHIKPIYVAIIFGIFYLIIDVTHYVLSAGLIYLGLQRAQNSPIRFKMVSYVFNRSMILKLLVLLVLEVLIVILASLVFLSIIFFILEAIIAILKTKIHISNTIILMKNISLIGLSAVCIIYVYTAMYAALGLVLDEKLGPWSAIKMSFRITKSKILKLIGLYIVNLLIFCLSIIPAGVGLIWTLPYMYINYGVAYRRLKAGYNVSMQEKVQHNL